MKKNLNIRIGIIGAGAAGLTAADALKSKGYTDITVLEKNDQAGGKCRSFQYEGRFYEMGAGIIIANNHTVQRLAQKYEVKVEKIDFSRENIFFDIEKGKAVKWITFMETLTFIKQIFLRYRKLIHKYHKVTEVGLVGVNPDLSMPFREFAAKHKINLVAKAFGPFFTGFGYGYADQIPAAYVLKYYSWVTLKSFIRKAVFHFPTGIQSLWQAVAKAHNVMYETAIKSVKRGETVKVETESGVMEFDELIVASPLADSLKYLDAGAEEKDFFSRIIYCDYRTYAVQVKDFPKCDGYAPGNFESERMGHPVFWYHRYEDSNLYTFYILGDWKITDSEVMKNIETVVTQLGGTIEGVLRQEHWKYFPHVTSEDMKNGYFDKVEAIQGKNKTYYTGESLNFSTVEFSAEHAADLVARFF